MLVGENGIITKAKENTELAEQKEKEDMAKLEDEMNEAITGIEVEQVTDENSGVLKGSGTDTNPYTINSIEDLVFFANDVTTKYKGLLIGRILGTSLKDSFYKEQEGELAVGSNDNGVVENIKILDYAINALSIIGADFKEDANNINNEYPVLIWQ